LTSIDEGFQKKLWYLERNQTDSFDLVSVFEKLIESYQNAFVIVGFIQNRFMDGATRNDYLKLRTKSHYAIVGTTKKSLEPGWRGGFGKRCRRNKS
jgi:hypothetical protein